MSLAKKAQLDLDGVSVPVKAGDDKDVHLLDVGEDLGDPMEFATLVLEDEPEDHAQQLSFILPLVPGGEDQKEIVVEEPAELSVEETPENIEVSNDPKKWKLDNFMHWLHHKMNNIPKHSGHDTAGLERTISYLEFLDREISKAVRMDIDGILDVDVLEKARDELFNGIERCEERLDKIQSSKYPGNKKKKKKADEQPGLVKEAQKAAGFTVMVPLFISHIARVCINSMVSAGHDIEVTFGKLVKKYGLDKRDQAQVLQLLADMNYPVRRDRGFLLDEEVDPTSSDNMDWAANYPA